AGARALHEQVLAVRRRVLGEEHPDTTISAWNLFMSLLYLQEVDAAREILVRHLAWLLQTDPQALSFEQQQILGWLEDMFYSP
ncbi:MAG TPA: tetratricopeptide repeat-containing protein, partial [Gammaproteobacteria bacterium]|nr:tetratricopeptide repeat-containing protein [Gammaproteobacteria bacterium]